jgi:mono/diheme cytochrome c family protein
MRSFSVVLLAVLAAAAVACGPPHKSSRGFHLPDGNVEAGKAAFLAMKCHSCHRVSGVDLPAPVADPPVPVELGGRVIQPRTDGELVTEIISPSRHISPRYDRQLVAAGPLSRMPGYEDQMTVQQLRDIVAFLQSRYEVIPPQHYR